MKKCKFCKIFGHELKNCNDADLYWLSCILIKNYEIAECYSRDYMPDIVFEKVCYDIGLYWIKSREECISYFKEIGTGLDLEGLKLVAEKAKECINCCPNRENMCAECKDDWKTMKYLYF